MSKYLLLLALVGCGPDYDRIIDAVEEDYPVLKCVTSHVPGAVSCKDLDRNNYLCYARENFPNNTVCFSGISPSIPKTPCPTPRLGDSLTIHGGGFEVIPHANPTTNIDTYYSFGSNGK